MLLTFISRRYSGPSPAYWARHFACALDLFQLLTTAFKQWQIETEGAAMSSSKSRSFPNVKGTLYKLTCPELRPGE